MRAALILLLFCGVAHAEPEGVTFDRAVQLALDHAADARIAQDEVARADALLTESKSTLRPLVGVQATYQQLEGNRYVSGRETTSGESLIAAATVTMPLLDFRRRADVQRSRDQLDDERAQAATIRRTVAIQTGHAYLSVFAAQRLIEVATLSRDTAKAHVDFAIQRTRGGIGTEIDIVRAQAELATDEANLETARAGLVQAEEALGVLAGGNAPLDATTEPTFPDTDAVKKRADVVAGEQRLSSAEWSREAQWAEYVPTLSLNAQAFYDTPQIDPLPQWGFQALVALAVPLYDGGYRSGLRDERNAVLAEAQEQLEQTERTASAEIRQSRDAVDHAKRSRDAAHRSADFAAHALDLANIAYSGGTGTSLEVIDAQRSARDAATQAVIADDNLRQTQFSLLAATGHFPDTP
jgi:outer membrane protein TolC